MVFYWTDKAISLLLKNLKPRISLWDTKSDSYKRRNLKKTDMEELLKLVQEELPEVDLITMKNKIQGLRSTFREEIRKVKQSESTGIGRAYVSRWKYYEDCSFLKDVIVFFKQSTYNNTIVTLQSSEPVHEPPLYTWKEQTKDDHSRSREPPLFTRTEQSEDDRNSSKEQLIFIRTEQMGNDHGSNIESNNPFTHTTIRTPVINDGHQKRKRNDDDYAWMGTAASASSKIANVDTENEDQWDIFGKDVAMSIRIMKNVGLQRRTKFAIQSVLFNATEQEGSNNDIPSPIISVTMQD